MSYSEAFMGTGRKQTDVEKLAETCAFIFDLAGEIKYLEGFKPEPQPFTEALRKALDLLAEASDKLAEANSELLEHGVTDYELQEFLAHIAPLVKQHRGE